MVATDSHKTTNSMPRWEIPETWAWGGHCPACGARPLQVVHLPDYPDYLICRRCELSFEVEMGGRKIHIKNLPEQFESFERDLCDRWVDPNVLSTLLENKSSISHEQSNIKAPAPLSDDEVWNRAFSLYRLGNKPIYTIETQIRAGCQ
jgi:hypothetical protein